MAHDVTVASPRFWVGVASRDHVLRGVASNVAQIGHGKRAPLARMHPGDWIAYYSPRTALEGGEACHAFTAVGRILPGPITQVDLGNGFQPYRRPVAYLPLHDAPIRPLLPDLSFILDKSRWGYVFRFGHFEIPRADFIRVVQALRLDPAVLDERPSRQASD